MKDMSKIKELAKQILAACDEEGDIENGTAPEHVAKKPEGSTGEKSLGLSLAKYAS